MSNELKKRGANFSRSEVDTLINIVFEYKDIVENKKTDATTWKSKNEAWEKITVKFNCTSGNYPRSAKTIRSKYDTIKKELRKKRALIKVEATKTGGGIPESTTLLPYEEKILSVTQLSMMGLPSRFDCDEVEDPDVNFDPEEGTSQEKKTYVTVEEDLEGIEAILTGDTYEQLNAVADIVTEAIPTNRYGVEDKKRGEGRRSIRKNTMKFPEIITAKLEVLQLQKELLLEERREKGEINKIMLETLKMEKGIKEMEFEIKKIQLEKIKNN